MAKVTSKLQVTVPKALADKYGIRPGDEIEWVAAGDTIRIVPPGRSPVGLDIEERLELFDAATERQRAREEARGPRRSRESRGWTRDELYDGG